MPYIVGEQKEVGHHLTLLMTPNDGLARKEKEEMAWTYIPSHNSVRGNSKYQSIDGS